MCWRDDVRMQRWCSFCGQPYYGDLGHRNCPKFRKEKSDPPSGMRGGSSNENQPGEVVASKMT